MACRPETLTPAFKRWFRDSKVVGDDGCPLVVYRGTRNHPQDPFISQLGTPSFTSDPRIASVYSHLIVSKHNGWSRDYKPHGSVHPVYLSIQNPVKLSWPSFSDGGLNLLDLMRAWRLGQPNGATFDDGLALLKAIRKRQRRGPEMKIVVYHDRDAEDVDEDSEIGFDEKGRMRVFDGLDRIVDEWESSVEWFASRGPRAREEFLALAYRVVVDAYAVCDTAAFTDISKRLGFDGVVYDDVTQDFVLEEIGYDPNDFERGGDNDEEVYYVTWRPFFPERQVKSVWNRGTWDAGAPDTLGRL